MMQFLSRIIVEKGLTPGEHARVDRAGLRVNSAGFDPWGVNPVTVKASLALGKHLYRRYFRVETTGLENIPSGRALLIGNHSGQLPIDGMLVMLSMLLDAATPRLVRGMVERWFPSVPFVGNLLGACGQVVGDQRNCRELLEQDELVMAFPEGIRGSGKTFFEKYQLQKFGTGFVRLALETQTPIVPFAVIGCEETYPSLSRLIPLAKPLGLPYLPLLPLGPVPLPAKVTIRYGKPLRFTAHPDAPDSEIATLVENVKSVIAREIRTGIAKRGSRVFTAAAR